MRTATIPDPDQLEMFGPLPEDATERTIEQKFRAFHLANEHVYDELVRLARELVDRGHQRVGIGLLFEVLRWQRMMSTEGDPYKLNNSWRSRYARLIARNEPDLADVFETRELRSA